MKGTGMKETVFYIVISIKTANGLESIGKFYIGNNREKARTVFSQLNGNPDVDERTILTLDLVETVNDLPLNMQMITCTLKELGDNCKIIVRETFKFLTLGA
jgi:hypothetical protein